MTQQEFINSLPVNSIIQFNNNGGFIGTISEPRGHMPLIYTPEAGDFIVTVYEDIAGMVNAVLTSIFYPDWKIRVRLWEPKCEYHTYYKVLWNPSVTYEIY